MIKFKSILFEMFNSIKLSDVFKLKPLNLPNLDKFYEYSEKEGLDVDNAIDNLPKVTIGLHKLTPTKEFLNKDKVKTIKNLSISSLPFIYCLNNIYYIIDGHHRITSLLLNGITKTEVRLFKND